MNKHFLNLLKFSNLAYKEQDPFSEIYIANFDTCINLAKKSCEVAAKINLDYLKRSLCHLDFVNKNLIISDDKKIWVIDFDKCKFDFCVHDISYFLRRILKRETTLWNLDLFIKSITEYENLRPLNLDEYKYIIAYLAFPQKYWKISKDYYSNINKCNKTAFLGLIQKAVKNVTLQEEFITKLIEFTEHKFNTKI